VFDPILKNLNFYQMEEEEEEKIQEIPKVITEEELKKHDKENDSWVAVH
jgi:cytochrome b involved in lipid metabolism